MAPKKIIKTVAVVDSNDSQPGDNFSVTFRKRSENWSEEEKRALVVGVLGNWEHLFGKLAGKLTPQAKQAAWMKISTNVNSVSHANRPLKNLKDQWTDLKSRLKKRTRAFLNAKDETGGGEVDIDLLDLTELEEIFVGFQQFELKLLKKLGNAWVKGIEGGIDLSDPDTYMFKDTTHAADKSPSNDTEEHDTGMGATNEEGIAVPGPKSIVIRAIEPSPSVSSKRTSPADASSSSIPPKKPMYFPEPLPNFATKKAPSGGNADISNELLQVQRSICAHVKRLADTQEELLRLKKLKYGDSLD